MRNKERIPIFLNLVDWTEYISSVIPKPETGIFRTYRFNQRVQRYVNYIKHHITTIRNAWLELPDYRIAQILIHLGILPNYPGFWFYKECYEILDEQGIPLEEYLYWTSTLDANLKKRPSPVRILIKDLETTHIINILKEQPLDDLYTKLMLKVLSDRGEIYDA